MVKDRWADEATLFTLIDPAVGLRSIESSTNARLAFGARLARAQALRSCDWILYTHLSVARVQTFVPPMVRRPYAVFIHGIEVWRPLTKEQRAVLQGAALRVANSAFTATSVETRHPTIGPVLPCPLALPRRPPAHASAAAAAEPTVLIVARMSADERYKGHDALLEAWPAVLARVPRARLLVVGDGDDRPRLQAKAADIGADRVAFTGFVPEDALRGLYREASVFAMPSRGEGFGLVYLEAMAEGLPCVGGCDDAARDVIVEGETGYLVAQSDRTGLVERLTRLLTDDALRRSMGEAGRRRVEAEFSYDQFARRMVALLEANLVRPSRTWRREAAL